MTVSSRELIQTHADGLAALEKFYPSEVAVLHQQLRHLVSVVEGDLVYFVNGHDIFVLDLKSNQRTLLATVPFEARCLAADHGWVGVGGESNGDCAFIKVDSTDGMPKCFGNDLDVQVLGGEIVNSMNIHLLREVEESEPEPVALISNNDRTVKIYSLVQRDVLATIEHDTPMNHAVISPDSTILAAVGDSDRVYFYQRRGPDAERDTPYPEYDWRPMAVPQIPTGSDVNDDYAFAVAFSPSGHLCAASAQGGAISVFDMKLLLDPRYEPEESILCTFRSSRESKKQWGCVRSMTFSPAPWDLLAWAEDHGRVGVADVRQMFVRRQTFHLDKDKTTQISIQDSTPPAYRELSSKEKLKEQHMTRLQSREAAQEPGRSASHPEPNRALQRRQDLMDYQRGLDLDARERSVLEALDTSIHDVVQRTQPYSVSYTSSPQVRPSQSAELREAANDYDVHLLNPGARHGPRVHQPRRRTSVVLSGSSANRHLAPPESTRARLSESPGRMTDDELPPMSTNDLTPTRGGSNVQPLPYDIPASDPWDVIQSALESARRTESSRPTTGDAPVTLAHIEAELEAERAAGTQLERQLAEERQLSDLVRRQLDNLEQIRLSQQREFDAEREATIRLEPSVERLLQRELRSEQHFVDQRRQDLDTEMRLGMNRARRLHVDRARILQAAATLHGASDSQPSFAQTTTLPTTNSSMTPSTSDLSATATNLQRNEAFRRQRLANIENLERQHRGAERRIASAISDFQALELPIQRTHLSDRLARQSEARYQAARTANMSTGTLNASGGRSEQLRQNTIIARQQVRQQAHRQATSAEVSAPPPHRSELVGRVSLSDVQVGRMMFAASARRAADSNGNWVSEAQIQRMYQEARIGSPYEAVEGEATFADLEREVGPGTAGIGWSSDGRRLYCGTEQGIFEFRVNLKDRMQFPSLELR